MEGWGCPLCKLVAKTERIYLDSLNYERVLDLNTRDALKASWGLCPEHSRDWEALQGSALGIAIVYRVAVLDLLRATEPEKLKGGGLFKRGGGVAQLAESVEPTGPCPACKLGLETAERFADLLLKDVAEPEVQAALAKCGGLCLPHLRLTLARPGAGRGYRDLVAAQRQAWEALMAELDEFIRKNDYRFQHEPVGEEGDSWLRALDAITGMKKNLKSKT